MDKKKTIAAVVAVILGIVATLTQIDFKGQICGVSAENSQGAK